jgi:hypothetical protein
MMEAGGAGGALGARVRERAGPIPGMTQILSGRCTACTGAVGRGVGQTRTGGGDKRSGQPVFGTQAAVRAERGGALAAEARGGGEGAAAKVAVASKICSVGSRRWRRSRRKSRGSVEDLFRWELAGNSVGGLLLR